MDGAEISARIHRELGNYLDTRIELLTQLEAPLPDARTLEALMFATKTNIAETLQRFRSPT